MAKLRIDPKRAAALWDAYLADRTEANRNAIVELFSELCAVIAWKNTPKIAKTSLFDVEDLIAFGTIGLIGAVERFDPSVGVKFPTFAARRILGAMLDAMREQDWVPRSVRDELKVTAGKATEIGPLDRPDLVESTRAANPALQAWLQQERTQGYLRYLDSMQRTVLAQRAEGCDWREIADRLGITIKGAKQVFATACERLENVIRQIKGSVETATAAETLSLPG